MNNVERDLRAAIEERIANVRASSATIPPRTLRAMRWRRVARMTAAVSAVFALGVGAFTVSSALFGRSDQQGRKGSDVASSGTSANDNLPPWMQQLTPQLEIAAGVRDGTPWSLVAFKVLVTEGSHAGEQGFCSSLRIGTEETDAICDVRIGDKLGTGVQVYPVAYWRQHTTAITGFTSGDVADVELRLENGTIRTPELQSSPSALTPAERFFVAFVDPSQDIEVIALDDSRAQLETTALRALARLTVTRTGAGSGLVIGRETCSSCTQALEAIVECGDDCWAEFEIGGGSITLEAKPEAGSTFAGWSGACTGTKLDCLVNSDSDVEVTARFEPTG